MRKALTVIVVMSVFATQAIGLTSGQANIVLLMLTVVAVVASFGWGFAVERFGPKRTLMYVLGSWCVGLLIAASQCSWIKPFSIRTMSNQYAG